MLTDTDLYFKFRCLKGFEKRGLSGKEYEDRLNYEMDMIIQMGFPGYFLIVEDLIRFALSKGIPVGPGRGSAAGSLAAYCLYITHLDPIEYGLVFERFLNPARVTMPDVDMDFCKKRREEVIDYATEKYGEDCVAHIGTFNTAKARAAIRDVAHAVGAPYSTGDRLSKLVLPPIEGKTQDLEVCYEKVPELRKARDGGGQDAEILKWAEQVEERPRSFGTHASGVVIAGSPIASIIPLYRGKKVKEGVYLPATSFEMNTVEEVGLIKFDFLGIKTLTIIDTAIKLIEERHGKKIDPLAIPLDDEETYRTFQRGDVDGIFQFEGSSGIRDLTIQIKPENLNDLSLINALYRPGPLRTGMTDQVVRVRNGAAPSYHTPELIPILEETGGVLTYQEQILRIARELAGYTLGEADKIRKAVGKKIHEEMVVHKDKLRKGMAERGISEAAANQIWEDIEGNASYSFNKAHSACYSFIGYQTAYLKTHFPVEFMCACLAEEADETEKVIKYIGSCKEMGITILPPDINESSSGFTVGKKDDWSIRFGLSAIKNLGVTPTKAIIRERNKKGPFTGILDFTARVDLSKINRKKLESLIQAGAFDSFGDTRASLMHVVQDLYDFRTEQKRYEAKLETYTKTIARYEARQVELEWWAKATPEEKKEAKAAGKKKPGKLKEPIQPEAPTRVEIKQEHELDLLERLGYEKELLGYYISGHPLDEILDSSSHNTAEIKEDGVNKQRVEVVGVPNSVKVITTKKTKQKMAYVALEDKAGIIEAVVLPNIYGRFENLIDTTTPAKYKGALEVKENDTGGRTAKLVVNTISEVRLKPSRLAVKTVPLNRDAIETARQIRDNPGSGKLKLMLDGGPNRWTVGTFSYATRR